MYCDGIKLAIKLVDVDAIIIKIKTKFVINKLSNFPIISVGFVNMETLMQVHIALEKLVR